jgi:hypothetical protein
MVANVEVIGNNLTPQKVRQLEKISVVAIKFTLGKKTRYGEKIESALNKKYSIEGKEPDYGGNIILFEKGRLVRETHDCRDSSCGGLGVTFYVSGQELQKIAKN